MSDRNSFYYLVCLLLIFFSCTVIKNYEAFLLPPRSKPLGTLYKTYKSGCSFPTRPKLSQTQAIHSSRLSLNFQEVVHSLVNFLSTRKSILFVISAKAASLAIAAYLIWKSISKGLSKSAQEKEPVLVKEQRAKPTIKKTPDSTIFEVESTTTDNRKVFSYFNETYIRQSNQKDIIGLSKNPKFSMKEDINEKKVTFEQMLQRAKTKLRLSWTPHAMIQSSQSSNSPATVSVPINIDVSPIHITPADNVKSESTFEKLDGPSEQQTEVDSIVDAVVTADALFEVEETMVITPEILLPGIEIPTWIEVVDDSEMQEAAIPNEEAIYSQLEEVPEEVIPTYKPEVIIDTSADDTVYTTELMSLTKSKKLKEAEILEDVGAASALLTGLILSCFFGPKVGIALVATSGLLKKKADTDVEGGSKTIMQLFGRAIFESAKLLLNALNTGKGSVAAAAAEPDTDEKFDGQELPETDRNGQLTESSSGAP